MIATTEVTVIAVAVIWGNGFRRIISADILAGMVAVLCRFVPIAVVVNVRIVAFVDVAVTVDIRSSNCLTVGLGIQGRAVIIALAVCGVLGNWTVVVAISVSVVTANTTAFGLPIHGRFCAVALAVNRMERTVKLPIVTEFAGLACDAGLRENPADIGARCGRVGRANAMVALRLYEIATLRAEVNGSVVVARFVCRSVASGEFRALFLGINFGPEHIHKRFIHSFIHSFIKSFSRSISHPSISRHIVVPKWQNHLKVGADKPKLKVKMQLVKSVSIR